MPSSARGVVRCVNAELALFVGLQLTNTRFCRRLHSGPTLLGLHILELGANVTEIIVDPPLQHKEQLKIFKSMFVT